MEVRADCVEQLNQPARRPVGGIETGCLDCGDRPGPPKPWYPRTGNPKPARNRRALLREEEDGESLRTRRLLQARRFLAALGFLTAARFAGLWGRCTLAAAVG